ncbi:hypothetical protein PS1_008167 [Malus domestica]
MPTRRVKTQILLFLEEVGCQSGLLPFEREAQAAAVLQQIHCESEWGASKLEHVSVLVKVWTWITDNLDNLYSCPCGLSCLWTKSYVLVNKPDALLFETTTPPLQAEMEVIRSEMLDRENIQKFWDEKMNAEKTRGLEVEKAYLAALSDSEQEKIIQEKNFAEI